MQPPSTDSTPPDDGAIRIIGSGEAMETYIVELDGHDASDLYELFLEQVEKPLFEVVMDNADGNITKASDILGMNRGTLRTRLRKYGLY